MSNGGSLRIRIASNAQRQRFRRPEGEPVGRVGPNPQRLRPAHRDAVAQEQVGLGQVMQLVAPAARRQQHRERGVLGVLDPGDRVHHDGEVQRGDGEVQRRRHGGHPLGEQSGMVSQSCDLPVAPPACVQ
jgi:hypothetical protein